MKKFKRRGHVTGLIIQVQPSPPSSIYPHIQNPVSLLATELEITHCLKTQQNGFKKDSVLGQEI